MQQTSNSSKKKITPKTIKKNRSFNIHSNIMCKGDTKSVEPVKGRSLFMFSVESFSGSEIPSNASQFSTGAVIILFLIGIEMSLRLFFTSIKVRKRSSVLVHLYMYIFVISYNSSTQRNNAIQFTFTFTSLFAVL